MASDPVDTLTQIRHIITKTNDRQLIKLILDLEKEFFALKNESLMFHTDLVKLKQEIHLRRKMRMRPPSYYYFQEGDDIPFCPACWERRGKAIHLRTQTHGAGGIRRECQACKETFWEKSDDRKARVASQH